MDLDPVKIFMFLLKVVPVIIAIVILAGIFSSFNVQIKAQDLERFSLEMGENIMSSPKLIASKYVFSSTNLDLYNQNNLAPSAYSFKELPFLRSCNFAYFAQINNLKTGSKWSFGYRPSGMLIKEDVTDPVTRTLYAGISVPNFNKRSEFYGTVDSSTLTLTAYNNWFVTATCNAEKAYYTKEVQQMTGCADLDLSTLDGILDGSSAPCVSLKRFGADTVCFYYVDQRTSQETVVECRYMPPDADFMKTHVPFSSLPSGVHPEDAIIKFYPVKAGSGATCGNANSNLATGSDPAQILICVEAAKK